MYCSYTHRKTDEGCIQTHPLFVGMYTDTSLVCRDAYKDTSLIFIKSLPNRAYNQFN